jgi:hypothetical protein
MNRIHNFNDWLNETTGTGYLATGTKFSMFGSNRVDIRVIDSSTGSIVFSKGADGEDLTQVYNNVVTQVNAAMAEKGITGVTLPTVDELQDSSK